MKDNLPVPDFRVAVHLHLHYTDLLPVILFYLRNIPFPYDLFVTVTDGTKSREVLSICSSQLPLAKVSVLVVENKGRDVKPFYTDLGKTLLHYDYVAHIHGKKSLFNNGATTGWLEYILDSLMGSPAVVDRIFMEFVNDPSLGMVYPANFARMPYWANAWLSNRGHARRLQQALNIRSLPDSFFPFPVGNMFWARGDAIRPLFGLELTEADYPQEAGQLDGEIMHALERITTVLSRRRGYRNRMIKKRGETMVMTDDEEGVDISAYYRSSLNELQGLIDDPSVQVVSFDIFDTLIFRKVLQPADLFDLMQEQFERESGLTCRFSEIRMQADGGARMELAAGEDVSIDAIYIFISQTHGVDPAVCDRLKGLELELEMRLMERRQSVVAMMDHAYDSGKRVILTSDMYLRRDQLALLLDHLSVKKYHRLYVSSTEGWRKDNRTLFPHILEKEGIQATAMLHIGDNEHSDLQIPGDLGIRIFHVLKPRELFAATKWGKCFNQRQEGALSVYENVSLAMSINKLFDDPFPSRESLVKGDLRLFGYYYFGQTLLSYVKWVADSAVNDKVERLYFLSRDGEILYKIYQLLRKFSKTPLPEAKYIELSRRSIAMPLVEEKHQADRLLSPDFLQGSLKKYIMVRLGIDLSLDTGIDLPSFGFSSIDQAVTVPADLDKLKKLAHHLMDEYQPWYDEQRKLALAYLAEFHFFDDAKKAVVDIGYSGTMQNLLNQISVDPINGYYMITQDRIDAAIDRQGAFARGLFGDRIKSGPSDLAMARYSLFYEMILSSLKGTVIRYEMDEDLKVVPVYETVTAGEGEKMKKLPLIHSGILNFCNEYLSAMGSESVCWRHHQRLYEPFVFFLENPMLKDISMLAGYSIDDEYCGNGILYWSPRQEDIRDYTNDRRYLWKYMINEFDPAALDPCHEEPAVPVLPDPKEIEVRQWYQRQYEILPGWYKKLGHVFKMVKGHKRLIIKLEDSGQNGMYANKTEEIQAWYNKEYEVLPLWYKRLGHIVQVIMGVKRPGDLF